MIYLLLFFVFSFLFKTDTSFDQDLGRHIKLGEIVLQNLSVPKVNLFSYTNPDFPFINTHWLFEVIVYLFNQAGILQLLLILKVIIFLFSVWLIIKIIPAGKRSLLLPIAFIFLHVLRERTELRPEIFSFLFTAITYFILETSLRVKQSNLLFVLPFIQLIWINTHIYFFVGLVLQAIYLIHIIYQKLRFNLERGLIVQGGWKLKVLGIIFGLSVILSLVNPNGINGLLYPLNVAQNYGYTIVENQTLFLLESINFSDPNFLFVKASWGIIILSIIWALFIKKFEIKNLLLALFGLSLSLMNVRSFPYLVFISLPAVLMNLPSFQSRGIIKFLLLVTCSLLLLESLFYLNGSYYLYKSQDVTSSLKFKQSPQKAVEFLLDQNLPQPIFNNFDIGSYIIYRGYPKYQVFVDGRPEAYPADFFQQTYIPIQSDYAKFKEAEKTYNFQTVIFSHTDQTPWGQNFLQNIVKDSDWKTIYIDDFMLILVKKEQLSNLEPINLTELSVKNYRFTNHIPYLRMGIFLFNSGNQISANQFLEKAYQLFPQSPILTGEKSNFFW